MLPRESLARTGALVRHNLLLMLREPGPLLSRLIMPLAFLTLLRPLYLSAQGRTKPARNRQSSAPWSPSRCSH